MITYNSVLISGAGTPLGQRILELLSQHNLKTAVLIDSDPRTLEWTRSLLTQLVPTIKVACCLSTDLTAPTLASLFQTHDIKYVFDLDRVFVRSSIDGADKLVYHRNLQFPKLLLDCATSSNARFILSLSAIPLIEDEFLTTAHSLLENYAQQLDTPDIRVISCRVRAVAEDPSVQQTLLRHLWDNNLGALQVSPLNQVSKTIVNLVNQIREHSSYNLAVWEITHVYTLSQLKLPSMTDWNTLKAKLDKAIHSLKTSVLTPPHLFPTSQKGAAIVADSSPIETNFEQCFQDLKNLMTVSSLDVSTKVA